VQGNMVSIGLINIEGNFIYVKSAIFLFSQNTRRVFSEGSTLHSHFRDIFEINVNLCHYMIACVII
jgi:hypothetical protein